MDKQQQEGHRETPQSININPIQKEQSQQQTTEQDGVLKPKPNKTGIPNALKASIEYMSQVSLDDVRVHYNSDKPATIGANAYAKYPDIYIAPGQEKHLSEELWHIVQQLKDNVAATNQIEGTPINDQKVFEEDAKKQGSLAQKTTAPTTLPKEETSIKAPSKEVAQLNDDDEEEEETELQRQVNDLVTNDKWNDRALVKAIGEQSWNDIKEAWDLVAVQDRGKLTLLRLKGSGNDVDLTTYENWSDNFMGQQDGHKWGTETEGGNIKVFLKKKLSYKKKEGLTKDEKKALKKDLKEQLTYFKRTALMETETHTLALDNVNSTLDNLLAHKATLIPIEIASKAKDGQLEDPTDKASALKEEKRDLKQWPKLTAKANKLETTTGTDVSLEKFNALFRAKFVNNIVKSTKPQHVTTSGKEEDRLAMAKELEETSIKIEMGTRGKRELSAKPKTTLEFLRHSSLNEQEVAKLEAHGQKIREELKKKLGDDTKFADEELNGIIVPTTGVPRMVGGYTLATPMTNAFPLLQKGQNKVTALREYR
ncbi:MAG: hypothetical protein ACRBFS_07720 [Aureispira sp.]